MAEENGPAFSLPAVAVRMRPRLDRERLRRERVADRVQMDERSRRVVIHSSSLQAHEMIFDHVFASRTSQHRLYTGCQLQRTVKAVARGELQRACVIAYGQSGSGKTYSLYGDEESPAIVQHAARDVFKVVDYSRSPEQVEVRLSFLEVYNDRLHDLLDPSKMDLHVRDAKCAALVEGLSEHVVRSTEDVMRLVRGGLSRMSQHAIRNSFENNFTHTILGLRIMGQPERQKAWEGLVQFVDLAGADKSDDVPQQSCAEARKSSLALFSLAQVVIALVRKGTDEHSFIPYRNSVLTRLLKGSLNGSCRTLILVCISPLFANLHDTLNTLKFAMAAKSKDDSWRVREQMERSSFAQQVPRFKTSYSAKSGGSRGDDQESLAVMLPGQLEDDVAAKAATQPVDQVARRKFGDLPGDEMCNRASERLVDCYVLRDAMEPLVFAEAARSVGLDAGNYILYLAEKGMRPEQFAETARSSGMSLVEFAEYTASAGIHPMDFARHYGIVGRQTLNEASQRHAVWAPYLWDSSLQELLDYGSTLEQCVKCQDWRVGDRLYRSVFTGADGAALFIEALEGVSTVSEAERVGEKLILLGVISPAGEHRTFVASPRHWYRFTYEETVCSRVLQRSDAVACHPPRQTTRTPVCAIL